MTVVVEPPLALPGSANDHIAKDTYYFFITKIMSVSTLHYKSIFDNIDGSYK